jgi:hypothetical protein
MGFEDNASATRGSVDSNVKIVRKLRITCKIIGVTRGMRPTEILVVDRIAPDARIFRKQQARRMTSDSYEVFQKTPLETLVYFEFVSCDKGTSNCQPVGR